MREPLSKAKFDIPFVGIWVYDNVIDNGQEIIDFIEDPEWADGWSKARVLPPDAHTHDEGPYVSNSEYRSSSAMFLPLISFRLPDILMNMHRAVWEVMEDYNYAFGIGHAEIENPCVNRYEEGEFYKKHWDYGPGNNRVVSAVLFLNDVEFGGELVFTNVGVTVRPRAGRIVVFPSNYIYAHEAKPPRTGKKYSVAYWAQG